MHFRKMNVCYSGIPRCKTIELVASKLWVWIYQWVVAQFWMSCKTDKLILAKGKIY